MPNHGGKTTFEFTVERCRNHGLVSACSDGCDGLEEATLEIQAAVDSFRPGRFSGPPEDCYPDEGGEVEFQVDEIRHADGTVEKGITRAAFVLTPLETEAIEEKARTEVYSYEPDYEDDDEDDADYERYCTRQI